MPFIKELSKEINNYINNDLPNEDWYNIKFYPFIKNRTLRERLIVEFKNARKIYKIFEGLQAKKDLLLAQIKIQVIMYVSIQEAAINYILFEEFINHSAVDSILHQERYTRIDIPTNKKIKLKNELYHNGKDIIPVFLEKKNIDKTKIRYDQKINVCHSLSLIDEEIKEDLILLYEYRNTIHIEAELKKNLDYDLKMGKLAYRRVEGLSMQLEENLKKFPDKKL